MSIQQQIESYISSQPAQKQKDMHELNNIIMNMLPNCKMWFLDGKDEQGRTISNPNIGYGTQTLKYANDKSKEFYQIGLSANTTGISVYILGIKDKKYLAQVYGKELGKAKITGYCIKFKSLKDLNIEKLESAIKYGIEQSNAK